MGTIGIDWSRGSGANCDPETGIRYGIVSANVLGEIEWEGDYGEPHCPKCGEELTVDQANEGECPKCEHTWDGSEAGYECYPESPCGFYYEDGDVKLMLDESNDVWIFKSPVTSTAAFCSPCAPGACYVTNYVDGGATCYSLPDEWWESGKAPGPLTPVAEALAVQGIKDHLLEQRMAKLGSGPFGEGQS